MKVVQILAEAHMPLLVKLEKVLNIVKSDKERRFVVVFAPANAMLKIPRYRCLDQTLTRLCGCNDIK